jgi:hypothetical protein
MVPLVRKRGRVRTHHKQISIGCVCALYPQELLGESTARCHRPTHNQS